MSQNGSGPRAVPGIDPQAVWQVIQSEDWRRVDDETLDGILDRIAVRMQEMTTVQKLKEFHPSLIIIAGDAEDPAELREIGYDVPSDQTSDDVEGAMAGIGRTLLENRLLPYAVFLIAESWMGHGETEEERREAIVATGMTVDGRQNMAVMPMHRQDDETFRTGSPEVLVSSSHEDVPWVDVMNAFFRGYFEARLGRGDASIEGER